MERDSMKWLTRIAVVLLAIVALAYGAYELNGGAAGAVRLVLPDFPTFPEPTATLSSGQAGEIYFESATPFDFDVLIGDMSLALPTTGVGTLVLPEGASPQDRVPAMIVVHGSGGISPGREREYAELLAANGYAAFVLDYYLPRGATQDVNYMIRVLSITEFDAITDAYAALSLLQTHPDIDPSRIGVMGFSYGGMAARFSMDARVKAALAPGRPGFAAHVDYYGPCFQNLKSPEITGAPLLTLRGTEDASNELPACLKREAELSRLGAVVEAHVYEGAGHAWESTRPRQLAEEAPYVAGCEVEYDEKGRSLSGGRYIVDVPVETPRAERITVRLGSGDILGGCVKSGYVIGRDDDTKARSDAHLLDFLGRVL
jgi:dienelactone hydrolase